MNLTIDVDSPAWKLAGMEYRGGYYTPEQWEEKTGVNPRHYPQYFKIWESGLCSITDQFSKEYKIVSEYRKA